LRATASHDARADAGAGARHTKRRSARPVAGPETADGGQYPRTGLQPARSAFDRSQYVPGGCYAERSVWLTRRSDSRAPWHVLLSNALRNDVSVTGFWDSGTSW